jgi:hypothetical protein
MGPAMRRLPLFLLPVLLLAQSPPGSIVIDGSFSDWDRVRRPAPGAFRELRITHDHQAVYFLFDAGRLWSVQQSADSTGRLLFDADANPHTGQTEHGLRGVDFAVELSPPHSLGVSVRVNTPAPARLTPYEAGFFSAPTFASERFELRLARTPERFPARAFHFKLVLLAASGEVLAETAILRHNLAAGRPVRSRPSASDPLARAPGSDFRVVVWNVSGDKLLWRTNPFLGILGALDADLILLDEVSSDAPVAALEAFLARVPGPEAAPPWQFLLGTSGFRERGLIAARSHLAAAPGFENLLLPPAVGEEAMALEPPYDRLSQSLSGGVPAAGAIVNLGGRRLFAVALDLVCCAERPGGALDRIRHAQAAALHHAIRESLRANPVAAVLVGGDFNLVGLRTPLDTLRRSLDPNGSALALAEPVRLSGISNTTWADPASPFPPGRLDFLLYSASSLEVARAFVFDTRDLPSVWLAKHHLMPTDSPSASDHFPIVADFRWR